MSRYFAYIASLLLMLLALALVVTGHRDWIWLLVIAGGLSMLGSWDLLQKKTTLRRNYPILAHFRYGLESIGPEMRQYFVERDTEEVPYSREQRTLVYQRAKSVSDVVPFGSELDVYGNHYEWINHSIAPSAHHDADYRIEIGAGCAQPYSLSAFNISAMSFGALSANAIRALNWGAKRGGFAHDTGEGSISEYHREYGGDLIWEIGSGYFGCRNDDGSFNAERFAANARDPQVKMVELKLSQGAKPGHGGMLPAAKVTREISAARGVPMGVDCVSPARHTVFSTPVELLQFIAKMREMSGGKPAGFKLAIGHPWEWFGIAKAMQETGLLPDFIVVDGAEGGTGAAPSEFINHVGVPMHEGLQLVHNTLIGLDLRDRIRIGAAGKIVSAFDIARTMALGADWCNAARGFMFSLGCIQAQSCHNDHCPTGIATQDPTRWKQLDVEDKAGRVHAFHDNTLKALRDLLCAAGLTHPTQLGPEHILRRVSPIEIRSYQALFAHLKPGELLSGEVPDHAVFRDYWPDARSDSFSPPSRVAALRLSKSR
ncbi:FMN-binding glutamate synthase family protein [Lysobacter oculi]|uniref:FMN-binding glutamate synthase family protein n=1 Tax=Solilutibacter oculi TaxID=2698682 RepID=A0A344J4V4_9GAMM|nr:FMN-binding glutamate synthase family protein [Lysobacter oculi]AXA84064.1 FMN-binding glutamate synthase family protein [Lysobacter oculi]